MADIFHTPAPDTVAKTTDTMFSGYLDPVLAQDYFAEVAKVSIVQQIARKIPMGPSGVRIPHWTGEVTARWVAETEQKPVTKGDMTKQDVVPFKIATIFAASSEVVRANPANYLSVMRAKVAEAIALSFDQAVLHKIDSPFGTALSDTTKTQALGPNAYDALNGGLTQLLADGKKWTGTLLDSKTEPVLNASKDAAERPLFLEATYTDINSPFRTGRVIGRPTYISDHVAQDEVVGFMGDFSQLIWGQIGGLSYDVSDQATLDLSVNGDGSGIVSLWQQNMVAIRVEAEFAALVNDPEAFVKLTDTPAPKAPATPPKTSPAQTAK
jgi:HK97 family phage major capsid protein